MNFDPKAIRRALMIAKDLAVKIDPGFAVHNLPMPPQGVPLERAEGGQVATIEGADRERGLAAFMRGAHPALFNKNGKPKVFYHGTSGPESGFSTFKPGTDIANIFGVGGIYLTENPEEASSYSGRHSRTQRNVMPVHVSIKNPYVMKGNDFPDVTDLQSKGYDGIIDGKNVIPFYPHQIKSAVGNVGTFDPANPDITKAEGGLVKTIEGADRERNLAEFMRGVHPLVPAVLYTGTTGDFSQFDRSRANIESDLGAGFYASNTKEDVSQNYAGEGPDLTNKLERIAEDLGNIHDEEIPHEELMQHARERLGVIHKGMMMPIHMALKNPVVLGGKHETFYDLHHPYDEKNDEYGEPHGKLIQLHDAFKKAASEFEVPEDDIHQTVGKLMERGVDYGGLKASEVESIIKNELANHQDPDTGDLASNEILRKTFEHMGHDGIIDTTVNRKFGTEKRGFANARIRGMAGVNPETIHYIAFHPNQIKSALGNRGTFDRREDDITKAEGGIVEDDDMPARKLNDMGMYSAAAEAARNLPQERGTLQQMLATMKGVKPDEIDWSGVQQKFAGQKTVTRDELAQHFENNMPPVQDNIRSRQTRIGMVPKYDAYTIPGGQNYQEFVLHMPKEDVEKAYPGEVMYFRSSHWSEPNVIAHLRTKDRMLTQREKLPKSDTQIDIALRDPTEPKRTVSAWTTQTPGLAVTKSLDEKGLYNVTHIGSGLATNTQVGSLPFRQAMDAARRLGEYYDGWTSPGDEIKAQLQQKLPEIKNIISSSINPSAKKALHLEELQSDWAQKGRDESFVDSEKVKKANAELQNYRQSMRDEYERSLIDRLQKGQPIKDEEKEQMLAGQYKDLYDLRKSFEDTQGAKIDTGNEYQVRTIFPDVRELPFENDKKGLFLYDNNSGEIIDDEKLWPDSQDRLNRMRKAFEEIQNFEKYAKENPEWLAENVNEYVYGLEPKIVARHLGDHAFAKHVRMTDDLNNMLKGIDEGPFVTSTNQWTDLGLKRALVEAARGNYDKLIWTPGKEQAQRYKLNNFIDALSYKKSDDGYYDIVASKRGNKVHSDRYKPEDLPGVVGQEMAKKIIAGEGDDKPDPVNPSAGKGSKFIRGVDLNVGGRGMYEYYDKILPRRLLALAQEHDPEAKILPTSNTVGKLNKFPSLDITPRMRQSILKRGFRMFARGGAVQKHLFDQAIEPAQVNVPEMDSQKTIRRALMIAKQEGGGIKGKTMRGSELQQKMARAGQEPVRFSSLKSSVPFPEMQAQYVSKQSLSPFAGLNPEQLQREGAVIIPAVGDRSMAGQILTHIGEIPLTKPIDLQGGAEFQRSEFEPAVWASQKGVISRIARKAAYAGKEGAPVYMSHVAMAPGGADASHMMVQALLRQIPNLKISKQAKNEFNQKIQEIDGLEEFPGVHKPEQAEAFLMGKSMKHRKAFAEEMDKARWSKENFPDVAQTRFAITEPRLMTAKTGATGFSFGRIDPAFEAIKDPERKHESYDTQLRGAGYAGGLTSQVPMSVMFPDWYAQQSKQTQADPVLSLYSLTRQLPTQQASQEWLDQLMSHLENMPEKWGYKKGGKVGKK